MVIVQNTDTVVRFTLKDLTGTVIVPSTLNAYEIYIYRLASGDKILIGSFRSSNTGLYAIIVNDDATGKVDIILNRELTRNIPAGKIYAEIRIRKTAASTFISSLQNSGEQGIEIGNMITSSNKTSLT